MPLYELRDDYVEPVEATTFSEEGIRERDDLQRLLRDQLEVLVPEAMVIAEEFGSWTESRRRIDLLALDEDANLVVIELKRTEDGGHMELQAVRYAAMVSNMTFEQVVDAHSSYLAARNRDDDAEQLILDHLGWDEPDEDHFAQEVRIILAAAEFSKELTTSVLWLNERGLDIRCVRLKPYRLDDKLLVEAEQIIPLKEAEAYQVQVREKVARERSSRLRRAQGEWTGYYYVNVADGGHRSWEDCRRYGFLAAGNGAKFSKALRRLHPGDWVYAYQRGAGYVGFGEVTAPAVRAADFVTSDGKRLFDQELRQPGLKTHAGDPEREEWAVAVRWEKTLPIEQAKTFRGAFANQNAVCRLRDQTTLDFLAKEFGGREPEPQE